MVMTIGELHAGHRIDPSLADAVKRTQRNPLRETPPLTGIGRRGRSPTACTTHPDKVIFGCTDLSGCGTDRVVRPFRRNIG
jgi:hypothetical protein